jgi:membrane associated rhomboid family serine protease
MVFPIGDDNSDRRIVPLVNYVLIAANVLVFVFLQGMGSNIDFTYAYACVPAEIVSGKDLVTDDKPVRDPRTGRQDVMPGLRPTPSVYLTLLTSIFMHGGIAPLLGNMWFLWIFGDNVEDDLGHARYAAFYLVTGLLASLAHVMMNTSGANAFVPSLGASGAISGVMGAYIVMHPHRNVQVILFRFLTVVPGYVAVGIWFLFQLISSMGMLGGEATGGGIAYAAHIGGFIAGAVLIKPFTLGLPSARHGAAPERDYDRQDFQ